MNTTTETDPLVEAEMLFSIKEEMALLKNFGKLLTLAVKPRRDTTTQFLVMDPANVMGVIPLTDRAARFLARFADEDEPEHRRRVPTLTYDNAGSSAYGYEYLSKIMPCLDGEKVTLRVAKNYPLTIEDDDFRFILAPRVDND